MDQVLAILLSFSLVALTFIFFRRGRGSDGGVKLPPGSFGWPIMGETMEFLLGKPEKFVGDRMKKYSPDIFKTKILGEKIVVICGPDDRKFLFTNEQKYFTSFIPHPMQHLFLPYQNKESQPQAQFPNEFKKIGQPAFLKPESVMGYLAKMDSIIQQKLQDHCEGQNVVLVYPLAKTVILTIACQLFLGTNNPERIARLVKSFDEVTMGMHSIMLNVPGTSFYRANKAATAIKKELLSVIKEKKKDMATGSPIPDMLSHFIVFTDPSGKSLPDTEIAGIVMGFLVAGYGTVSRTITFLMKYVGLNPEIYEKIRAEQMEIAASKKERELLEWKDVGKMKYSWNAICETMRLVPPLQGSFREVLTEINYAGYTIPKGWKVFWTGSTTNMNPEYFREPEKFNPSRYDEDEAPPPYTYVPFGGGPRTCPGKEYARIAMLAFIHNVVKKYKWEVIDPNEKMEGDMMPEPQKGLPIRLYISQP